MIILRFLLWLICAGLLLAAWIAVGTVCEVVGLYTLAHRILPLVFLGFAIYLFCKIVPA